MSGMFTNWDAEHSRQIQHEQQLGRQAAARRKAEASAIDWQARAEKAEATVARVQAKANEWLEFANTKPGPKAEGARTVITEILLALSGQRSWDAEVKP